MILDNIKDLIKEMEGVLIKDPRFKEDIHFKNMVKTIYTNNSSKLKTIHGMPSYDVTPIILGNLSALGKASTDTKLIKVKEGVTEVDADCDKVINDLKAIIAELIKQVGIAHKEASSIGGTLTAEQLAKEEEVIKMGLKARIPIDKIRALLRT
jgi:hypothetical protein